MAKPSFSSPAQWTIPRPSPVLPVNAQPGSMEYVSKLLDKYAQAKTDSYKAYTATANRIAEELPFLQSKYEKKLFERGIVPAVEQMKASDTIDLRDFVGNTSLDEVCICPDILSICMMWKNRCMLLSPVLNRE